jgi:hypothetical protein
MSSKLNGRSMSAVRPCPWRSTRRTCRIEIESVYPSVATVGRRLHFAASNVLSLRPAFPSWRVAVRKPGKDSYSRKSPLVSKPPGRQLALLCPRANHVRGQFEKRSDLFKGEHLVNAHVAAAVDLYPANGNLTFAGRQSISKQLADEMLLRTTGRLSETIERGRLMTREANI